MKISELKESIYQIGFYNGKDLNVTDGVHVLYIEYENQVIANVHKSISYLMNIDYEYFSEVEENLRKEILDILYKFASTPPPERQDV